MNRCYAEGSRGIECDPTSLSSFSMREHRGKKVFWSHAGWICKRHYDILAKMQGKPDFEAKQQLRVAGKYRDKHSPHIPDKEWWDDVLLPSYRNPF